MSGRGSTTTWARRGRSRSVDRRPAVSAGLRRHHRQRAHRQLLVADAGASGNTYHEKPEANWVTPAKVNAIRGEVVRQCDELDGLVDGVVANYMACRAIFDISQGAANRNPWSGKRCPNNVDPNPGDTSANACLTDGQTSTLKMVYSPYRFATPLANGVRSFGMWTPNTNPSGSGLIVNTDSRGKRARLRTRRCIRIWESWASPGS